MTFTICISWETQSVAQNDTDIELVVKKKLYAPVFKHGLELFASGLFVGLSAVESIYLAAPVAARTEQIAEESLQATGTLVRVGQWMSKEEYDGFINNGIIPRANVLTNGNQVILSKLIVAISMWNLI
jgi:hypothetical protein